MRDLAARVARRARRDQRRLAEWAFRGVRGALLWLSSVTGAVMGSRVCNVCDKRAWRYIPLPKFYADNLAAHGFMYGRESAETCSWDEYSCPACQATDRDRLYALYLREYLSTVRQDQTFAILDIAPSPPLTDLMKRLLTESGRPFSYRTADLNSPGVDDRVDIMNMVCYKDDTFHLFLCSHVLEHVVDDRKAIAELFRILKPGGVGILMVPINLSIQDIDEDPSCTGEAERWRRFGQFDHVRMYSRAGFVRRVEEGGFRVQPLGRDYFGEIAFGKAGLTGTSVLYVVQK